MDDRSQLYILYRYSPSMAAAIVFVVLFCLSSLHHATTIARHRAWYFIPFLVGCIFECVGYIGRALSASEAPNFTKNPYIIQSLLLLLGPNFFAASIYMILGRLAVFLEAANHSVIRPKRLTKVFVTGDVLSFLAQSGGGAILATAKDADGIKRGENIILAGLGIQVLFFGCFMIAIVVFHKRIRAEPTPPCYSQNVPWKTLIWIEYATSTLIMVRSIFRVAEYAQGRDGQLQSNEIYLYIFDAALMVLVTLLFNVFPPSRVLNSGKISTKVSERESAAGLYPMSDLPSKEGLNQSHH